MTMFSIFEISASAMTAQSQRMNATASNMANADTVADPNGEAYRAKSVTFAEVMKDGKPTGGVQVTEVVESQAPLRREYRPDHPLADDEGYISKPNVDPVSEMVDMISASRSYQANVEVMKTSKELIGSALKIGEGM